MKLQHQYKLDGKEKNKELLIKLDKNQHCLFKQYLKE